MNDFFFLRPCWFHHDRGLYGDLGYWVLRFFLWGLGVLFIVRNNWSLLAFIASSLLPVFSQLSGSTLFQDA